MTVVIVYVRKIKMAAGFSCRPKRIERVQPSGFETQGGGTHLVLPGLGQKLLCFFFVVSIVVAVSVPGQSPTHTYIHIYTHIYIYT